MAKGIKGSSPTDADKKAKTSFITTYEKMEKLRYVAFMSKREIGAVLNDALDIVIAKYEKENGAIPVK